MFANIGPMAHAEGAVAIGQAAEEAGFESLWAVEHTVLPAGYQSQYPHTHAGRTAGRHAFELPSPFIRLTSGAGQTSTHRLGPRILTIPLRKSAMSGQSGA